MPAATLPDPSAHHQVRWFQSPTCTCPSRGPAWHQSVQGGHKVRGCGRAPLSTISVAASSYPCTTQRTESDCTCAYNDMASSTHVGPSRQSRSFKPTATSLTSLQDHSVGEETLKAGVPGGGGSSFYPPPFYNTLPLLLRPILLRLSLPHPDHHCPLPNLHQDQNGRALALYLWNQAMYAPPLPFPHPPRSHPAPRVGCGGATKSLGLGIDSSLYPEG